MSAVIWPIIDLATKFG